MIRHIVMFEFAKEANGKTAAENAVTAKERLLKLQDTIDVIRRMEVGINHSAAKDENYTICLTCDFDSMEDLNTYIVHPDHVKIGEFMRSVRTNRACVDYEI